MKRVVKVLLSVVLVIDLGLIPGMGALANQYNGEVLYNLIDEEKIVNVDYEWNEIPTEVTEVEVEQTPYLADPQHTRSEEVITEWWKVDGEIPNNPQVPDNIEEWCVYWGIKYSICPELLCSMCKTESTFRVDAVNGQYTGVMQVGIKVHKNRIKELGYEIEDMKKAECCIHVGADIMAELLEKYDYDIAAALIAYNQGNCINYLKTGKLTNYASIILEQSERWERENGK